MALRPTLVRLEPTQKRLLEIISKTTKKSEASLVRMALAAFLRDYEVKLKELQKKVF